MDVLKPPIVTIKGRCYRRNPAQMTVCHLPGNTHQDEEEEERYAERDEEMYDEEMYDEGGTCDPLEMEQTREGYRLVMNVPSQFFGYIIGQRGETRKRIEQETQTFVNIPKQYEHRDEITITGKTRQGVASAKARIDVLKMTARQKMPMTHFVAIPLNDKSIKESFQKFQENVLLECRHCSGVDERIFQVPSKLHLTITVLTLMNKEEVEIAQRILDDCLENIINPVLQGEPLVIDIAGLEYMNDDPGSVHVLYAEVKAKDGSNRLQEMADRVRDRFYSTELCQDKHGRNSVKLHATLMNSAFKEPEVKDQRSDKRGGRQRQGSRESFDASEILELFGGFDFGELHIKSLNIAERGRYSEDGFYFTPATIKLP